QGKCLISRVNFCACNGVQEDSPVWHLSRKMDGTSILSMNWANPRELGSTGPAISGRKIGTKARSIRPTESQFSLITEPCGDETSNWWCCHRRLGMDARVIKGPAFPFGAPSAALALTNVRFWG